MSFAVIPIEILEEIVSYLDITSALAFIQVDKRVNTTFRESKRFWTAVAEYIGLEVKKSYSVDAIKKQFVFWKSGTTSINHIKMKLMT